MPIVLAVAATKLPSDSTTYDNTAGDFILGFRQVGSTSSILADIGPITDFTTTQTFSLGAFGSLLSSTYGSDWATNPDVFFSLAATTRPQDGTATVNYVTSPEYPADGAGAVVWSRLTQTNSNILKNKIIKCGTTYNVFTVQSGTSAVLEPSTSPDAYQNFMPGGTTDSSHATSGNIGWGYFNPTPEGSFKNGATGVILHLIQLIPGSGPGTDLGNFVLSADGNTLTFTPASPASPTPPRHLRPRRQIRLPPRHRYLLPPRHRCRPPLPPRHGVAHPHAIGISHPHADGVSHPYPHAGVSHPYPHAIGISHTHTIGIAHAYPHAWSPGVLQWRGVIKERSQLPHLPKRQFLRLLRLSE